MARGSQGDPRRKTKGGRYTPPRRNTTPDQPVRVQVPVHTGLTTTKQPPPAISHSRGLPPIEQLPQDDQTLLRALSIKIGKAGSTTPEGQNAKEEAFHEAVSELHDYILALRAKLDRGLREPHPSE